VIRLVTQFDDPRARPLATTASGACCSSSSCCCCIASAVAVSGVTAMHLGRLAADRRAEHPDRHSRASLVVLPALGALALAASFFVGLALFDWTGSGWSVVAALAVWFGILAALYRAVGRVQAARTSVIIITAALGAAVAEFFFGLMLFEAFGAYLVLALAASLGALLVAYRRIFGQP
jgi:hypothetical protein